MRPLPSRFRVYDGPAMDNAKKPVEEAQQLTGTADADRRILRAAATVGKGAAILGAVGAVVAVGTVVSAIPASVLLGGAATIYGVKVVGGAATRQVMRKLGGRGRREAE